jgi:hypothetical protein
VYRRSKLLSNITVREAGAFDGRYNIRLHPTHQGPLTRALAFPRSGGLVTPRGAGEPNRYTDSAQLVFLIGTRGGPTARGQRVPRADSRAVTLAAPVLLGAAANASGGANTAGA